MEQRNGITVCILGWVTCGIYYLVWLYQVGEEMRTRGQDIPPIWWAIIPILGYLYLWKWAEGYEKLTNPSQPGPISFVLLLFLGPIAAVIMQPKLNEIR